jgi:hypothetical protein
MSVTTGLPCVMVPVLSRASALKPALAPDNATLDQDAAARRSGETADDGDRRGDDQRAGAGDHQQDQRLVDPVHPAPPKKSGGTSMTTSTATANTAGV